MEEDKVDLSNIESRLSEINQNLAQLLAELTVISTKISDAFE
tara:strand:+ start:1999 stop:2124 length:126 start_codon:yes stop_codon:yes gene_type:complete